MKEEQRPWGRLQNSSNLRRSLKVVLAGLGKVLTFISFLDLYSRGELSFRTWIQTDPNDIFHHGNGHVNFL